MAYVSDLRSCADCHCLAARRHARAVTRRYDEQLREHGLRATQFSVLAMLALAGPKPLGELAEALGLERTTLTRSANVLSRRGWIRSGVAGDRRERRLHLTPSGQRKLEAAFPAWQAAQKAVDRPRTRASPRP